MYLTMSLKLLIILLVNIFVVHCQNDKKIVDVPTLVLNSINSANSNKQCDRGHVNDRFCEMEDEMKAIQEEFQNIQDENLQLHEKIDDLQNEIKDINILMKEMQNQILELSLRPCAC